MERNDALHLQAALSARGLFFLPVCLDQCANALLRGGITLARGSQVSQIWHGVQAQRGIAPHYLRKRGHALYGACISCHCRLGCRHYSRPHTNKLVCAGSGLSVHGGRAAWFRREPRGDGFTFLVVGWRHASQSTVSLGIHDEKMRRPPATVDGGCVLAQTLQGGR